MTMAWPTPNPLVPRLISSILRGPERLIETQLFCFFFSFLAKFPHEAGWAMYAGGIGGRGDLTWQLVTRLEGKSVLLPVSTHSRRVQQRLPGVIPIGRSIYQHRAWGRAAVLQINSMYVSKK